ncbi:caspase family protein [Sandarakinorhabdus sp.]|uniref:caspase family protein n=1 Tax=Sandarakinorhabdus sp. TaxID=1916663 RepID=UPI0033420E55
MLASLWFAGETAGMAQQPQQQPQITKPKIVVQGMQTGGIDVAAWSADSRHIFTASGLLKEFLVWDAARGQIIDRVRLPSDAKTSTETMMLDSMTLAADGRTLRIEGEILDPTSADLRRGRAYLVDVVSRRISFAAPPALPAMPPGTTANAAEHWLGRTQSRISALEAIYEAGTDMARADALRALPALPPSPDGRWRMVRTAPAFALVGADGRQRAMAAKSKFNVVNHAAMSPDGRQLALSGADTSDDGADVSLIDVFDITQGRFNPQVQLRGSYDKMLWLNANHYLAVAQDDSDDPLDEAEPGEPAPLLRIDSASGAVLASHPARCFVVPLPDGSLIGAGLANCRSGVGTDKALVRLVAGRWQALPGYAVPKDSHIRVIAASPRGDRVVVVTRLGDGNLSVATVHAQTGEIGSEFTLSDSILVMAAFSPDGRKVWLFGNNNVAEWQPDMPATPDGQPALRNLEMTAMYPTTVASNGRELLVSGPLEDRITRADLATGKKLAGIDSSMGIGVGFLPGQPILWSVTYDGQFHLWDSRTGQALMTTYLMSDQHFVTVAQDGRYDTNLGPDAENFRWFIPSAPFLSLAPQTFMRDYFEPQLFRKLLDCTVTGSCARVLKPVPPIAGLNFLLPSVRVTNIQSAGPGQADVSISVTEFTAQSGRSSGAYGAKLLMNNREVARNPDEPYAAATVSLAQWRAANVISASPDGAAKTYTQRVSVPTDGRPVEFAAYAFNSDRVKSDTNRVRWVPPAAQPRPRRAFVLTIGVDHYVESRLKLSFAVADARVIGDRLAAIPGYEMRHARLVTRQLANGQFVPVTRDHINTALGILAGFPPGPDRAKLASAGHDANALDNTTPDDIVIISFSGHGFADATGNFALLPSDVAWPGMAQAPTADTAISATDLTMWLRAIAAKEIAFIIDACHSGAAVSTPDFKPGPMGDTGLGQLAYDKGLLILAATQADDVALESNNLRQGLLTAALGEGLTSQGGPADMNRDGRVRLDEWLRYAVARLPSLSEDARRGGGALAARGMVMVMDTAQANERPRVQEPSLFNFNAGPSPVVLRGSP